MEEYLSWGIHAVKMKVGGISMREDAARVKAVREVIGDDTVLMMDANCAYRFYEAIEFGKMVEEYRPYWLLRSAIFRSPEARMRLPALVSVIC